MPDWRQDGRVFAAAAERRLRQGLNRVERVFDRGAYAAAGYRGYGTREKVLVLGRVLQELKNGDGSDFSADTGPKNETRPHFS